MDAIRASGGAPLWVMGHSEERVRAFSSACSIPNYTTHLGDLLADDAVTAVYIGSANGYHHAQVIAAAAAGKHVLCDKPLAVRSEDALEMVQTCERFGVALGINHHLRASDVHRQMRRLISQGAIGVVHSMIIHHGGLLRPELRTWRLNDPEMGGGIYLDLTVHDVDLARFLLCQEPVAVVGMGGAYGLSSNGLDDHTSYALRMTSGCLVQVHESFVTPNVVSQVIVNGSGGVLQANSSIGQRDSGELIKRSGTTAEKIRVERADLYAETLRQFNKLIMGHECQIATGWDGVRAIHIAEAVARAVRSGQVQMISEASEEAIT